MKNIFEKAKELNFIVPSDFRLDADAEIPLDEIGIIIHLYYTDTVDYYFEYIKKVPVGINVYISVSSASMKHLVDDFVKKNHLSHHHIIMKENRGRDISAILVACREIALRYKYICFIHDKKAKECGDELYKREIKLWIDDMWMNTVMSADYIYNVINLLQKRDSLGLLVPPEVAGSKLRVVYSDNWGKNFENTVKLAEELKLDCNLQKEYPPVSIGTVFWAKTNALEKLLKKEWKYEDFWDEPLPNDGTISHAIERILGYVAQDAGYDTGYIMANKFAETYTIQLKDILRETYKELDQWEIKWLDQLRFYTRMEKRVVEYMEKYDTVYFYGAGKMGKIVYWLVLNENKVPNGFLVSEKKENEDTFLGIPVYDIEEKRISDTAGIVITVGEKYGKEVIRQLEYRGIKNYITCYGE